MALSGRPAAKWASPMPRWTLNANGSSGDSRADCSKALSRRIVADRLGREFDQPLALGALGRHVGRPIVGDLLAVRPRAQRGG